MRCHFLEQSILLEESEEKNLVNDLKHDFLLTQTQIYHDVGCRKLYGCFRTKQKISRVLCYGAAALGYSQATELAINPPLLCRDISQKFSDATCQ